MNGYYGPNSGPPPIPPMQYGQPVKKRSKLPWVIAAAVAVLILLYNLLSDYFSPQKTAERYFKAVFSQDWETAYGYIEIPQGSLMTLSHFLAIKDTDEKTDVTNLKIGRSGDKNAAERDFMQAFTAYYTVKGENNSRTEDIQLVKQQEKAFLLFPKWKVASGNILAKNFVIFAPAGYKITVDKEALVPASRASDRTDTDDTDDEDPETGDIATEGISGYDTYVENMFIGQHTVTASAENLEDGETTFDLYSADMDYYKVETLDIDPDAISDMQAIVQDFMRQTYQDALAQSQPSEEYLKYWIQEGTSKEDTRSVREAAEDLYQDLAEDLSDPHYYDKIQFTSLNFSDYESQVNETYNDEQGDLYVPLYITYQYKYTYSGISTSYRGITTKEEQENTGEDDMSVTFKLEDGDWKIYSADMDSVY